MNFTLTPTAKRWLLLGAELLVVLIILGLLAAIWLPAIIGARLGSVR